MFLLQAPIYIGHPMSFKHAMHHSLCWKMAVEFWTSLWQITTSSSGTFTEPLLSSCLDPMLQIPQPSTISTPFGLMPGVHGWIRGDFHKE